MYVFYATVKIKKRLLELVLLLFNQIVTYCLAKMKTDTIILPSDVETVKFGNSSFTLIPSYTSFQVLQAKVSLEEKNHTIPHSITIWRHRRHYPRYFVALEV